ncbi:hypothetical protein FA95DRAFT_1563230 [Auriscalpium vulgare]|uniref:Uncharacterized protein n=1 Tax=Auriscalpium vulgare TaxID=40419 RepID=A0ACB8RHX6_9AGAM|nr:hypothetical protein FA95DRAFT_1563230 [Auriscalpium vulgare]
MLSLRIAPRASQTLTRFYHPTRVTLADRQRGKDPNVSQGHVSQPATNEQTQSVQSEYARAGAQARDSEHPYDSASGGVAKAPRGAQEGGNPERVGFADQVGGQSAHADRLERGGEAGGTKGAEQEAAAPGLFSRVKQVLGMGTSSGDVKQNRGAGGGVTGTGTFRSQEGR